MWRVGVDVGGTFTDLFGWNEESGERATAKVLATQWDRSEDVIDEYISVEHARDVYGVSVDKAARKINEAETEALRGAA
ncbi:MAG: hydantoinase/oxoprolinase N-terminal domain-containing protein [Gammaproteobacteria bacterium]